MWRQFSPVGGTCLPQPCMNCSWVTQVCLFCRVAGGHCLTFWLRSGINAMVLGCFPWISFMLKYHLLHFKETSLSGKSVRGVRVLVTCSVVFKLTRLEIGLLWHVALEALAVCMCVSWHCSQDNSATLTPPSFAPSCCPSSGSVNAHSPPFSTGDGWLFSTPIASLSPKCHINHSLWGVVTGIYLPSQVRRDSSVCVPYKSFPCIPVLMSFHFMVKGV